MIKGGRIVIGISGVLLVLFGSLLVYFAGIPELFLSSIRRQEWLLVLFQVPLILMFAFVVFTGMAYVWRSIKGK